MAASMRFRDNVKVEILISMDAQLQTKLQSRLHNLFWTNP